AATPAPAPSDVTPTPMANNTTQPAPPQQATSIFETTQPTAATPAPPAEIALPAPPPPPAETTKPVEVAVVNPTDPMSIGLQKLAAKDYVGAVAQLEQARKKQVIGQMGEKLTADQQTILVGLAAANIGRDQPG